MTVLKPGLGESGQSGWPSWKWGSGQDLTLESKMPGKECGLSGEGTHSKS